MKTDSSSNKSPLTKNMKIVVIGGSGLIGAKLVNNLRRQGYEVVAASPSSGVNTLTGEGLAEALRSSSTWRTRLRSKTKRLWNSSKHQVVIFWPRRRPRAWDITSRCRSWVPTA